MKSYLTKSLIILIVLSSCIDSQKNNKVYFLDISENDSFSKELFIDKVIKISDSIRIDSEMLYILEGDYLLNKNELLSYKAVQQKLSVDSINLFEPMLIILEDRNIIQKQSDPQNLKFAVIKSTFSEAEYEMLIKNLEVAANDWKRVCNVRFRHIKEIDNILNSKDNPDSLTFVIKKYDARGKFVAKSFFPLSEKKYRKILLDPSFFVAKYSVDGLLRHEFGHILGFIHEHIRTSAPKSCPNEESLPYFKLTDYDPKSVMHFFCPDIVIGNKNLNLTNIDSIGAAQIYPY